MTLQHKIYNEDGTFIIRDFTKEEETQHLKDLAEYKQKLDAQTKAEANKAAAQAKLEALGLTADDLKALGL